MARELSLQEAVTLAQSGDAQAQYALSAALHQSGQFEESQQWLRRSAAQGFPPARMTLATLLIDGRQAPRDLSQAVALLEPLAPTHGPARLLLSEVQGFAALGAADPSPGLAQLLAAGRLGEASALRQLALLCVLHQRWDLVRPLLDAAWRRGDAAASYALAQCYAQGLGGAPDIRSALALCRSPAARSQYLTQRLVPPGREIDASAIPAEPPRLAIEWPAVTEALPQLARAIPLPEPRVLHASPLIRLYPGALPELVLDTLINFAAPLVQRSQIVDARTGTARIDPMRSSFHLTLSPRQQDHVVEALERCISGVAGTPRDHSELMQILRYRAHEEYRPHVDYFNESGAGSEHSLVDGGQRAQTVLVYLNAAYEGGATRFLRLELDIKGQPGDLLHFHNLGADGQGHKDTLHAGLPVSHGEKWLLSQWIRSGPHPARVQW